MINKMILNEIKNTRILLHNHFYINENNINDLINRISNNFNLFSIDYNPINKIIQLKIKKTNMKKIDSSDLLNSYYRVINDIMVDYFINNYGTIGELMNTYKNEYNLNGNEITYLNNINTVYNFFHITIISDNIISIHL